MAGALFEVPGHIMPTFLVGPLETERPSFWFSGFRHHGNIVLILDCNPLLHLSKGNWTKIFIHLLCGYYGLCNWLKQPSYRKKKRATGVVSFLTGESPPLLWAFKKANSWSGHCVTAMQLATFTPGNALSHSRYWN
jgi:hypothetical protein